MTKRRDLRELYREALGNTLFLIDDEPAGDPTSEAPEPVPARVPIPTRPPSRSWTERLREKFGLR